MACIISCATNEHKVLLLKSCFDVLITSFKGKKFTTRIDHAASVPEQSLELWRKRGYEPAHTGIAVVTFDGADKKYTYPAYFWSD